MLIEFTVGNYRSFKDKVTFSMVAAPLTAPNPELDENNVFRVDDDLSLLKSAAIYGANASGKSNLFKAISFMRNFIINSSREGQITDKIAVETFSLSTNIEDQPSYFEIVFLLDRNIYRYGFEATQEAVVSEWLYYVPNVRETPLFIRQEDTYPKLTKRIERAMTKRTRSNALFLSVCSQFNVEIAENILRWVKSKLKAVFSLDDSGYRNYTISCIEEGQYADSIIELVKQLDLGFSDIKISQRKLTEDLLPRDMPDIFRDEILKSIETIVSVKTVHQKYDSQEASSKILFDLDKQESEGTRKIFALSAPIVDTLRNGKTLIIDEFDARLHPYISQAVVELFNSNESNPNNAQLIFITHDTNLLSNQLLRRDQIWFTEKDRYGATDLYSLAEYKDVRKDAAFEKNYIQGKYGAIPFLGDLSSVLD